MLPVKPKNTVLKMSNLQALSGGELQRFACCMCCMRDSDVFMFDEPSSYLDVKQRMQAARTIRTLLKHDKYVWNSLV